MQIEFLKANTLKAKPTSTPVFGTVFTDYMFTMEYDGGWKNAQIRPYENFSFAPSAMVFHYGQAIFEGLKAYKNEAGEVRLFRPDENLRRMNDSAARMCMPSIDEDFVLKALKQLVFLERDWIPTAAGTSLYIRPTMIAVEEGLGVHSSKKYVFFIILSPVGAYYPRGLAPVKLFVEEHYVRAVKGGTGNKKFAGNYAASLIAGERAEREGFDQVMWLDGRQNKYVEEVGSMNLFFVISGELVTPQLGGSILPGITRKSVIEYAERVYGKKTTERMVSIDELIAAAKSGDLSECFGTGTAAVISPVGLFRYNGTDYTVGDGGMGEFSAKIYADLTALQAGLKSDDLGWSVKVTEKL